MVPRMHFQVMFLSVFLRSTCYTGGLAKESAEWTASATWSEYALSILSAWISRLAQCKSKNPFFPTKSLSQTFPGGRIFWMQLFNTSFPTKRPEVESWHEGRGVNDTFLLLYFFHSWNGMQPPSCPFTSAGLRSSLLRYYISFWNVCKQTTKYYHHLVSWFVALFQWVVVWIQKCFLGTWPNCQFCIQIGWNSQLLCFGVKLGWCNRVLLWVLQPMLCFDWKELVWLSWFFIHANTQNCHSSYQSITSLFVNPSPLC